MKACYKTDPGVKRDLNQDVASVALNQRKQLLAMVCDGMGGHKSGDVAAKMVVDHICSAFKDTSFDTFDETVSWLDSQIQSINQIVHEKATMIDFLNGMGTTLAIVVISTHGIICANVGDTRIYFYKNGQVTQLSQDQTLVNILLSEGQITQKEAEVHPKKNILVSAMGTNLQVDIYFSKMDLQAGEILICSDGLYGMVCDDQIALLLDTYDQINEKVKKLIDLANYNGGIDNIGIAMVEIEEGDIDV